MSDTHSILDYNRDFYAFCPAYYLDRLDKILKEHHAEPYFEKAWNEYASIAASKPMRDIPEPNRWFDAFAILETAMSENDTVSENELYTDSLDEEDSDFVQMAETDFDNFYDKDEDIVISNEDFEDFLENKE